MCKTTPYIFSVLLLLSAGAMAQSTGSVQDTVVTMAVPDEASKSDAAPFDAVGKQSPALVRTVPLSRIDSLRRDESYWYANTAPEKKKPEAENEDRPRKSLFAAKWFRTLLWLIILCSFVGVVLWYLQSSNILLFRKRAKQLKVEEEALSTEDIFSVNYDAEISKAVTSNNYRLAVRLWYLHILKELSEKGLIDYRYGRTNQDYVAQLSNTAYHRDFFRLTRNFEYTWYGQFDLSAEAYEMMQAQFSGFKGGLRQ